MKMRLSKIALAIASLGTAQVVFALTPAQIAAGPTTYVWLSGASAPTNAVFRSVMSLCNGLAGNGGTNDAHMYLESTGTEPGKSSGDRVAYACTMSSAAGSLAGKKVVVYHTVEGGSFNAYAPHLSMAGEPNPSGYLPGNLKRVNNLALLGGAGKCAAGAAGTTSVTLNGVAYNIGRYNSCADVVTKTFSTSVKGDASGLPGQSYPDGGFSDTEYPINKQNLNIVAELGAIGGEVATNIGQAFGVAVSYPLYLQLQKNDVAAGLLAATCDDGSATAPNLTPACQPSLQGFDRRRGRQPVRRPRRFGSQLGAPRTYLGHPICFQHTLPGQTLCHGSIPRCTGTGESDRQYRHGGCHRTVQHRRRENCVERGHGRESVRPGCDVDGKHPGADRYSGPLGICQAGSGIPQLRRAATRRGDGWLLQLLV
jgi:hypothetical protein